MRVALGHFEAFEMGGAIGDHAELAEAFENSNASVKPDGRGRQTRSVSWIFMFGDHRERDSEQTVACLLDGSGCHKDR